MKKFITSVLLALSIAVPALSSASETVKLEKANIDLHNQQSLQRGAKYFVNYCMGCHSLSMSRYNRVATDLGLTPQQVQQNLIFTRTDGELSKVGELMKNGMTPKYGSEAFGNAPPDLSLEGRLRGGDWIYSFLKSFYKDPTRPLGVNNKVFANVGMPHILWELQGMQELEHHEAPAEGEKAAATEHADPKLILTTPGKMSPAEYDRTVLDIANFLVYVSEPGKLHRQSVGIWVLLFLVVFIVLAYFLKKEYWKDVH
jgi:ubiquinol-cytochrome c reductase cytochrome c1 subunit